MNEILKIVQALGDSNILLKRITKTINTETKEENAEFLGMLLQTLGASLLGNILTGKRILTTRQLWKKKRKVSIKSWLWK